MPTILRSCLAVLLFAALAGQAPLWAVAAPLDYDVASGHFFTQTGKGDGSGYFVLDEPADSSGRPLRFWSAFRRLGGQDTLGYPVSRPFSGAGGFIYQAFQRGVLQWRYDLGDAVLANTFDWLQQAGREDWLNGLGVPRSIRDDGSGGDWLKARQTRLSWLVDPRIKDKFLANPTASGTPWTVDSSVELYGLPTSLPERHGPFVVQRFQRIAFQLWLDAVTGMPSPGTVVGVLGGDLLKQASVITAPATDLESPRVPVQPKNAKGVYLSYFAAGRDRYLQYLYDLSANTEINAVVVDVKGDHGYTTYASAVPLAREIGAAGRPTVADFKALVASLQQRGLYVIARLVVFKDDHLAQSRPGLAIGDARTGLPWRDTEGLAWSDPYREEVWDYNIALAKEAALLGVDEVQFDFIRFPSDGALGATRYAQIDSTASRAAAINGFLARASSVLRPLGVKLSADLFGYTAWRQEPLSVGQRLEDMARYLDVVSPMLYPSTFTSGIPGYRPGVPYPYETVFYSTQETIKRLKGLPVLVRPWLQDFPDYSYDNRPFTPRDVAAQINAAREAGAAGWLLWNSQISYTRAALGPK